MGMYIKSITAAPPKLYPWQKPEAGVTTIGIIDDCYSSSHLLYGVPMERYRHRFLPILPLRKLDRKGTFFKFTPVILDTSLPLVHCFNATPVNRDFVVSYELELPRYFGNPSDTQINVAMRFLDSDRCKRILAMSDFAIKFAKLDFERRGFGHLVNKIELYRGAVPNPYPAGETRASRAGRPSFSEKPLSAAIIGTHLFRKGGMYAIQAFERLRAQGMNVSLSLIGDFETESYAFDTLPSREEWRARAQSHDWIRFTGPVPYAQVYGELLAHDLCVYTSVDESLGWVPIEAGMLGVPVIAARVCAFEETVGHDEGGWLVDLPLREDGRWSGLGLHGPAKAAADADANERLVDGIVEACTAVYNDPSLLEKWSARGHERTKANYGVDVAAKALERVYDTVLAKM